MALMTSCVMDPGRMISRSAPGSRNVYRIFSADARMSWRETVCAGELESVKSRPGLAVMGLGREPVCGDSRSDCSSRKNADICASWFFSFSVAYMEGPAGRGSRSPMLSRIVEERFEAVAPRSMSGVAMSTDRRSSRT